jgi:hypothetical protein
VLAHTSTKLAHTFRFLPAFFCIDYTTDFHARLGVDTVEAALQNAFAKAIIFDRVVLVPEGYEFFMGYVEALDIYGVTVASSSFQITLFLYGEQSPTHKSNLKIVKESLLREVVLLMDKV